MSQSFLSFLFALLTATSPSGGSKSVQPVQPMSQAEMESRVRIDVARELKVPYQQIGIVETIERTWMNNDLGCKGPGPSDTERATVPGFRITAKVDKRRLTYHTDRFGRVLQCAAATAPATSAQR